MTLFDMKETYKNILELINTGEATQEQMDMSLKQLDDEIEVKAENIAYVIQELEADVEKFKEAETRLSTKRKILENEKARLKTYLENAMIELDKKKIKTDLFSFNIQKNVPSLDIQSEEYIPQEFYKIEKKLDKKKLLDEIKNGLEIKNVSIKQTESLRIK